MTFWQLSYLTNVYMLNWRKNQSVLIECSLKPSIPYNQEFFITEFHSISNALMPYCYFFFFKFDCKMIFQPADYETTKHLFLYFIFLERWHFLVNVVGQVGFQFNWHNGWNHCFFPDTFFHFNIIQFWFAMKRRC